MTKLRIRRQRGHWIAEQNGQMVEFSRSFATICRVAAEWKRNDWLVARGWTGR